MYGVGTATCIVSFDPKNDWGHRFFPVPAEVIADQIEAATSAHDLDVVKIGMLGTPATIDVVADGLGKSRWRHVVLDPVLICKGQEPGAALDTDNALRQQILPHATVITPNLFEAQMLSGMDSIESVEDLTEAARRIHDLGPKYVVAKGGVELPGDEAVDVLFDGENVTLLTAPKVGNERVSGAGCTLAAAITAELAKGTDVARQSRPQRISSRTASRVACRRTRRSTRSGRARSSGSDRHGRRGRRESATVLRRTDNATESDVARRGFDTFALPRSGSISKAVVGRTQMRSTLDHPHRIGHLLLPHVATRVRRGATRASRGDVPIARCVVRSENVGGPLPHISGHVRQAISVDTEGSHRRGSDEPVLGPVLPRKASLPRVCQVPAPWSEFIAPDEPRTIETASCRELPFHLCGEVLACQCA